MSPLPRSTRPSSTPVDKVQPFCRSLAPIRSKSNQAPDRNAVAFVRNALQNCTIMGEMMPYRKYIRYFIAIFISSCCIQSFLP